MKATQSFWIYLLRAIEQRQMLFIRVFTMVFLAGLFFGTRGNSPRYVATVAIALTTLKPQMTVAPASEIGKTQCYPRRPDAADATAAMLNSTEFAQRVSVILNREVLTSTYHARPMRPAGCVAITSEAVSPSLAAETVDAVVLALISLESESRSQALARSRDYLARVTAIARERLRKLPPGDSQTRMVRRELNDYAEKLAKLEDLRKLNSGCVSRPLAGARSTSPDSRALLLPSMLALALAVLSVLVGNHTARRMPESD